MLNRRHRAGWFGMVLGGCGLVVCLAGDAAAADVAEYDAPERGHVRIVRDEYGVPHIIASENASLLFGAGYAQAEDQLENLLVNFMRAEGRAAEREGVGQVAIDHLIRLLEVPRTSREMFLRVDQEMQIQLDAFARGVNAYMDAHPEKVEDWMEPVEAFHVLGFAMYIDTLFAISDCRNDLRKAGIRLGAVDGILEERFADYGSNQFAVSPQRSATGATMLSMDPHLRLSGFFRWYEMHLVGPTMNVYGACFFGSPYVSMGRTETTAWCMTVNDQDLGDVFVFELDPNDASRYRDVDGWKAFQATEETYRVKTPLGTVERAMPCKRTEVGPVVKEENGMAYVFALPVASRPARARQLYSMDMATNVEEFRKALRPLGLVMFNIVVADKSGDIFYVSNGRVPKRDQRINSEELRPGHEEWARWQGVHRLEELPQVLNPKAGYLVNTNSGPQNVTPDGAPQPEDFPPYFMAQRQNSRWRRLNELLEADESITWEEMHTYATDTQMEEGHRYTPQIVSALRAGAEQGAAGAERLAEAADVLANWDRRTDVDSQGAVLFYHLFTDDAFHKAVEASDEAGMAKAAAKVTRVVIDRFGGLDAPWGDFSRIRRGDVELPIAGNGLARTSGGASAIGASLRPTSGEMEDGKRYCNRGSSYGMIVDFSGETRAISCLPFGVSEDPSSPHFADQMTHYATRQFKPVWFWAKDVAAHQASELVLETH